MAKKLFIAFVLVVFGVYCYASVTHYSSVPVPDYVDTSIDLMGGMSPWAWKKDPTAQNELFAALERKQYQPSATGLIFASGLSFTADHILTGDDLRKILVAEPVLARDFPVRDPVRLYALEAAGYTLRDNVFLDKQQLYPAQTLLNKSVIDGLLSKGIHTVRVSGRGDMVSPQSGTMLMVVLIFLGLLCALDLVLFKPLVALVDERNGEIEAGQQQARLNANESAKLAEEEQRQRRVLRREHIGSLIKARHEVMREADALLHEANIEAHRMRDNAHTEMRRVLSETEARLKQEVPALAELVVSQLRGNGR